MNATEPLERRLERLEAILVDLADAVRALHLDVTRAEPGQPAEGELIQPADACRVLGIGERKMAHMLRLTAERGGLPGIVDIAAPGAVRRRWRWRSDADVRTWADAVWGLGQPVPKTAKRSAPKARREPPRAQDGSVDFRALVRGS